MIVPFTCDESIDGCDGFMEDMKVFKQAIVMEGLTKLRKYL
jgi:hypothetical protein